MKNAYNITEQSSHFSGSYSTENTTALTEAGLYRSRLKLEYVPDTTTLETHLYKKHKKRGTRVINGFHIDYQLLWKTANTSNYRVRIASVTLGLSFSLLLKAAT